MIRSHVEYRAVVTEERTYVLRDAVVVRVERLSATYVKAYANIDAHRRIVAVSRSVTGALAAWREEFGRCAMSGSKRVLLNIHRVVPASTAH